MQDDDEKIMNERKKVLLTAIGKIVYKKRIEINKGINTFSFEYDIGNGLLTKLEKGESDSKISTIWKLANAFGYNCSDFIKIIEKNLSEDFDFYK